MFIHDIISTVLAIINAPDDIQAKELPDQYFCCDWVDPSGGGGAGTGGGCVKTTEDNINGCAHWLICPGGATGSDGVVTCTAPKKTQKITLQAAATEPDDDAEFCCDSVDLDDEQPRGHGCTEVVAGTEQEKNAIINTCERAIGCDGPEFTNDNGTVTCL